MPTENFRPTGDPKKDYPAMTAKEDRMLSLLQDSTIEETAARFKMNASDFISQLQLAIIKCGRLYRDAAEKYFDYNKKL